MHLLGKYCQDHQLLVLHRSLHFINHKENCGRTTNPSSCIRNKYHYTFHFKFFNEW